MNDLQELTAILEDLDEAGSFKIAAERLTAWARNLTGCESAILRLVEHDGDTSWLAGCAIDGMHDRFARDETVVHGTECICGRVATGVTDASLPFYTAAGSFSWGRLSTLTQDFAPEQLGPLRGRCLQECFESMAVFPLRAGRRTVGSLHLADSRADRFGGTLEVVEAVCRLAGAVLFRYQAREREQTVLATIETALLPPVPPAVKGFEIGVSFRSATEMAHVGGDFYDVLDLGDAGVLVLVGDVSGKGVDAVGTAVRARYVIEAQARISSDPASFLRTANDALAQALPRDRFVAAAACLIDSGSGSVTTCLAGHPTPLLITPRGTLEIDAPHNPPLGVVPGLRLAQMTDHLAPDDTLLVYTDGITDARRNGTLFGDEGITELAGSLAGRDAAAVAQSVCDAATEFHDSHLPGDDRLVVAVRLREDD